MSVQKVIFVIFLFTVINENFGQQTCSTDRSSTNSFASKTAYVNANTPSISAPKHDSDCKPLQIYGIFRHGTRYPSVTDIEAMINKIPSLKDMIVKAAAAGNGTLCQTDVILIRTWKMDFNGSMSNLLHPEGTREASEIAKRLKNSFPNLFSKPYSRDVYQFKTTDTKRTVDTAKGFVNGLFTTTNGVNIDNKQNEDLLRFYKTCKRWESEVDDNDTAVDEYFKFVDSVEFQQIGVDVSKRIGLDTPLNFNNVSILWEMCRFTTAWRSYPKRSPWCNLFTDAELEMLEYSEDVLYYWKEGYGYPINYQQTCPILVDLFKSFNNFKSPTAVSSQPAGLFHFTHSGLLLKLYARLGLFNDTKPLLADDYNQNKGRNWKTSLIDPFASNIVFVLFNCTDYGTYPEGQLRLKTYVQEREVLLANCSSMCPLDTVLATYGSHANQCDLETLCKANSSVVNSISVYLLVLAFSLYAYHSIM